MTNTDFAATMALLSAVAIAGQAVTVERAMSISVERNGTNPVFGATLISFLVTVPILWGIALVQGIPIGFLSLKQVAPFVIAGAAFPAVSRLLYYGGIERVGSSLSTAIIATSPAVAAILAVPILGDEMTLINASGLTAIVGGVVLLQSVGGGQQDGQTTVDPVLKSLTTSTSQDLLFPAAAAAIVGAAYILIDFGLRSFPNAATASAISQTTAVAILCVALIFSGRARESSRINGWHILVWLLVSGVFAALAWIGQFVALQLGSVTVVAPLINAYPLIVIAFVYISARQIPRSPRLIGAILSIVAGVVLLQMF